MYGDFESLAVSQARQEGHAAGAAEERQKAAWQREAMHKQDELIAQKQSEIEAIQRQLAEALSVKVKQSKASPIPDPLPSAQPTVEQSSEQSAALAAQRAEIDALRTKLRNEYAEQQASLEQQAAAIAERGKRLQAFAASLTEREKALAAAERHQAELNSIEQAAQRGDFGFSTASLARQVAICDERAAKALALADALPHHQLSDGALEARREAQLWMQQSRNASALLAKLPKAKEQKGNVDVTAICTAAPFLDACHRIAEQSPGRHVSCSGLVTSLLLEMTDLRTINNGAPLTTRQLGNAFATIGIRSQARKRNGITERCYAASDFILLNGSSQNALPSQGSGDGGGGE